MVAISERKVMASLLQWKLKIGYARAGRLIDEMEKKKIVSAQVGSKPRNCLITLAQWKAMKAAGR